MAGPQELGTDVVVVGGGLAGMCAATEAADRGADVVLLERQPTLGGSTVLSGGFVALADTPMQRRRGITDSADLLFDDLRTVGEERNDQRLVRRYADSQALLYDWLTSRGVTFDAVELSAGQSVARSHHTDTPTLIRTLAERAAAAGVTVTTDAAALRLLRAEGNGRVEGVLASMDGVETRVMARRGVVLASGGFCRGDEMLETFAPRQARALRIGGAGNTGTGLRMAWALGADMRDMGYVKGTFGTHPSATSDRHEILLAFYLGAIIVNREGQRFVDESMSYKTLGDACLDQTDALCYQVFDQTVMDASSPGVPLFDLEALRRRGLVVTADTWADLGSAIDVDGATLGESVARYNRAVAAGVDADFGRDGLCHHAGELVPLTRPPFYAFPSTTAMLATYCGLCITPETEVLDVFGDVIEGLYAAGEITGGLHGTAYMTGSSLGKSAVFGRIAGARAAGAGA